MINAINRRNGRRIDSLANLAKQAALIEFMFGFFADFAVVRANRRMPVIGCVARPFLRINMAMSFHILAAFIAFAVCIYVVVGGMLGLRGCIAARHNRACAKHHCRSRQKR